MSLINTLVARWLRILERLAASDKVFRTRDENPLAIDLCKESLVLKRGPTGVGPAIPVL